VASCDGVFLSGGLPLCEIVIVLVVTDMANKLLSQMLKQREMYYYYYYYYYYYCSASIVSELRAILFSVNFATEGNQQLASP